MGDAFNPYSHWLKLPPQRWKPTYYEILGIERSAKDKDAIIALGKKLYAEVKAAPLAGREKEHKALLVEIEEAVRTFASNTRRKAYDEQLDPHVGEANADTRLLAGVPTALAAPLAPTPAQVAASTTPQREESESPTKAAFAMPPMAAPKLPASIQPVQSASRPVAAPIAKPIATSSPSGSAPVIAIRTQGSSKSLASATTDRYRQQRSRQHSMLIALSLGGLLLVGGIGFLFREQIRQAIASAPTPPVEKTEPSKEVTTVNANTNGAKTNPETTPPSNGGNAEVGAPPEMTPEPEPSTEPKPEANPEMEAKPEVKPEMKPETKPEPTPPPAPIVFTAEDAAKLKTLCEAMVAALSSRNATNLAADLETAQALAKPAEAKATIEQLAMIAGPFRVFWNAFDESWKSLKMGDEVAVGASTKVKVASITESEIEIETASGKRKQTKEALSLGLLLGLVRGKLDLSTPDGKLALAIFHLVDKAGNAAEGAKLLAESNTSTLTVENIKQTLTNKFDFSAQVTSGPTTAAQPSENNPPDNPPASMENAEALVAKLRDALNDRNLDQATKLGAQIEELSRRSGANPRLRAEAQLAVSAGRFWDMVAKGIESFKGTEEIMVDDEIAVVIEAATNKLVCRIRGKRAEFTLKTIPAALALAIVEMKVDKTSADFELSRGALYFTQKPPITDKAKEAWQAAKAKGAEAADLLLTLVP